MTKSLLSGLFLWVITLSINTYASDDSPLPDVVRTPAPPAAPVPIPYPNIGKGAEKPDSKPKENEKRVGKDFYRRGMPRFDDRSNPPAKKQIKM
jgi:hypothetical protein